jgi:hypothetical protein
MSHCCPIPAKSCRARCGLPIRILDLDDVDVRGAPSDVFGGVHHRGLPKYGTGWNIDLGGATPFGREPHFHRRGLHRHMPRAPVLADAADTGFTRVFEHAHLVILEHDAVRAPRNAWFQRRT